jgi:hypothetical protein
MFAPDIRRCSTQPGDTYCTEPTLLAPVRNTCISELRISLFVSAFRTKKRKACIFSQTEYYAVLKAAIYMVLTIMTGRLTSAGSTDISYATKTSEAVIDSNRSVPPNTRRNFPRHDNHGKMLQKFNQWHWGPSNGGRVVHSPSEGWHQITSSKSGLTVVDLSQPQCLWWYASQIGQ